MRRSIRLFSILAPAFALIGPTAAIATETKGAPRALALSVTEHADNVELELIAHSQTDQQVEFALELTGSSTSRHNSTTTITAGERQVLSRLKTSYRDGWCAKVDVTEANGESYTLTAGDCAQG